MANILYGVFLILIDKASIENCGTIVFVAKLLQPTRRSISNGRLCTQKNFKCSIHLKEFPIDPARGNHQPHIPWPILFRYPAA